MVDVQIERGGTDPLVDAAALPLQDALDGLCGGIADLPPDLGHTASRLHLGGFVQRNVEHGVDELGAGLLRGLPDCTDPGSRPARCGNLAGREPAAVKLGLPFEPSRD
jgi:hypothetical protein